MKVHNPERRSVSVVLGFVVGASIVVALLVLMAPQRADQRSVPVVSQSLSAAGVKNCSSRSSADPLVVRTCDFGSWLYTVARDDETSRLRANVRYLHNSVGDLLEYAKLNRKMAGELSLAGGEAHIAVSFRSVLTPDQFRTWAKGNQLTVEQAQLTTGGIGFSQVTIGIVGTPGDPLPQAELAKNRPVQGVFGVYGTVPANHLSQLASDPLVFLLDVTPSFVPRDTLTDGVGVIEPGNVEVFLAFSYMQNLGLEHFSAQTPVSTSISNPSSTISVPSPVSTGLPLPVRSVGPTVGVPATTIPKP